MGELWKNGPARGTPCLALREPEPTCPNLNPPRCWLARRHPNLEWRTRMQVTSRSPTRKIQVGKNTHCDHCPRLVCISMNHSNRCRPQVAACHALATPWHYIPDSASSSRSGGLHQHRPTPPPICSPGCLDSHGQSLPSKPSTCGKQFGQDHTRSRFQNRLLVKHPASPLVFYYPHHQQALSLSRPSAGNVSALSAAGVKALVPAQYIALQMGISLMSQTQESTCSGSN